VSASRAGRLRAGLGQAWRDARANNPRPVPEPANRRRRPDPTSWSGAFVLMCAATAVLWVVQIVNASDHYRLNRFGMRPREARGLWGIVTQPFLHASYSDLLSNTAPVLVLGGVVLLAGWRTWLAVTAIAVVLGGAATWLVAPSGLILGASAVVFGWLGYLIARAWFSRKLRWILTAAAILLLFGTLLGRLLPTFHSAQTWQAHACGFGAGLVAGAALHLREWRRRRARRASRGRTGASRAPDAPVS
jgi:membrane associated rhomboid family serine protease